jgi:tetratricopeptide (TPR) repeat protein
MIQPAMRARTAPSKLLWVSLALLVSAVFGVVFVLPRFVSAPAAKPRVAATVESVVVDEEAARRAAERQVATAARDDWQKTRARAEGEGVVRWGDASWLEALRVSELAEARLAGRDFSAAAPAFRDAIGRVEQLLASRPTLLAEQLAAGDAAIQRADRAGAEAAFRRALLIAPEDPAAKRGLERVARLGEVLERVAASATREAAGDLKGARDELAAALRVDPDYAPARAAQARLAGTQSADAFAVAMAAGLNAARAGRAAEARAAYGRALALRPGDRAALAGLAELDGKDVRGRVLGLQAEAERLAASERWPEAVSAWEAVIAVDGTLAAAERGLGDARRRAALAATVERALAQADQFNDEAVAARGRSALAAGQSELARSGNGPAPVLRAQLQRLEAALAAAATPVPVNLVSDNLTNITVYKVGNLGAFSSRTVQLRPGSYVILGSREGFRDVRRTLRVRADGSHGPLDVRCEEPI